MSILTQKEREGLEDVFLSIKKPYNFSIKFRSFSKIWGEIYLKKKKEKELKMAYTENFRDKLTNFFNFLAKVKKNLSK